MDNLEDKSSEKLRSGVVTIIGRPSAGKSTFLNAVCKGKVSIVSKVPQSTRSAIRGILTNEAGQILFIDTPGLHESKKQFNEQLREVSLSTLKESDAVLYVIDSTRAFASEEESIFMLLKEKVPEEKIFIAINKCDEKKSQSGLIKLSIEKQFPKVQKASQLFEISSKKKEGLEALIAALMQAMPYGQHMYPPDFYTDQEPSFRISEIIREKAITNTREELPHAIYVKIDEMNMRKSAKALFVRAVIYVERESQKGIVIGKNAGLLKKIKEQSIKTLNDIFPYRINLSLQVAVDKDWRKNKKAVESILRP